MARLTLPEFCQLIDHTNLHAFASGADIERLCREAIDHQFKTVAINPAQVLAAATLLDGSGVGISACISFPLGQDYREEKTDAARRALAHGATEIDYVNNLTLIKDGAWDQLRNEMAALADVCHEHGAAVKVIFENCYLTDDEKLKLCEIASEVKPDFVKTSTGFGTGGATLADVELMCRNIPDDVQVKAAGGIRTADDFLAYVTLGATRIGCSAGIPIIEELSRRMAADSSSALEL
ncbi:MAG: deoxyribose-phosphate aldolase [Atopobiaceae bacterium]|nr:deoxyribose-phosphate aldolase [Atopobiaceae bacterium]